MSLATIMLEQLAAARRVIEDGHEMVPAWRIATLEGTLHPVRYRQRRTA